MQSGLPRRSPWPGRMRAGFVVFAMIGAFFLIMEHRAHVYSYLPWLLLAACPLMQLFMHRGHSGHGAHGPDAADAYQRLQSAGARRVVTCNTVPHPSNAIPVGPLLAAAVKEVLVGGAPERS